MPNNLVSIIMPCHNAEEYISETINSVLAQTYQNFEFLICDDCSTDFTLKIVESYNDKRIKVFKNQDNLGLFKSANKLIKAAKGRFLARIDSDDIADPERLAKQVDFLNNNIDIGCVGSNIKLIDSSGKELTVWCYPEFDTSIRWALMFDSAIAHPAAMFRKQIFEQVGWYDDNMRSGGDYELWVRMSQECKLHNIQENLLKYRIHEHSISSKKAKLQKEVRSMVSKNAIEKYCDFSPEFNMAAIETNSLEDVKSLNRELLKMSNLLLKRYPDVVSNDFIRRSIISKLVGEIAILPYFERLKCVLSYEIPLTLKRRVLLVIPMKLKRLIKKEYSLY